MPTDLLVYGAGGHAKVVLDALQKCGIGALVIDDNAERIGARLLGIEIGNTRCLHKIGGRRLHIAIGNNQIRREVAARLCSQGWRLESVVHPAAILSQHAKIAEGVLIAAAAVVGPDASIGEGTIINHGAVVDHDCQIRAYCHIAPNATLGGTTTIDEGVLVGSGATILPGIHIGENSVIAAGAVVHADVKPRTLVAGVPAIVKRSHV